MRQSTNIPRNGFSLIELLVVIGIIVTLMAILLPAVFAIYGKLQDVQQVTEIKAIQDKLNLFKNKYGRYPPSQIILIEKGAYDLSNTKQAASYEYLRLIFGINLGTTTNGIVHEHDWDGDGVANANASYELEGDQCLVFFLAGPKQTGFYQVKGDPCPPANRIAANKNRDAPFMEFDRDRLSVATDPLNQQFASRLASATAFPTYKDKFGTPYAYFLARDVATNNYFNDCPSLCGPSFVPYFVSQNGNVVKYHAPDTFQLIGAGRQGTGLPAGVTQFGVGGFYDRKQLAQPVPLSYADGNNYTNFMGGQLRYGQ